MSTAPEKQASTGWQAKTSNRIDRSVYWLSKHWLAVFNSILFIYVALPILAPTLMQAGLNKPAKAIYTIYSPLCHQMAQRSFFLFGEQPAYPREIAGTNLNPIEDYVGEIPEFEGVSNDNWPAFFLAARSFVGNENLGYKMALCERDIAIYGFLLVGGLLYGLLRKRYNIKPLPLILFIIIGIGPIALDGFSQLFSYWGTSLGGPGEFIKDLLPVRESTPFLRTFTGAWFGFTLAWLAFPNIAEGMKGTEENLSKKFEPPPPGE